MLFVPVWRDPLCKGDLESSRKQRRKASFFGILFFLGICSFFKLAVEQTHFCPQLGKQVRKKIRKALCRPLGHIRLIPILILFISGILSNPLSKRNFAENFWRGAKWRKEEWRERKYLEGNIFKLYFLRKELSSLMIRECEVDFCLLPTIMGKTTG